MIKLLNKFQDMLDATRSLDFLGSLAIRLYLAPVFWFAGMNKMGGFDQFTGWLAGKNNLEDFDSTVAWFGNPDWGLGLPMPELMAILATGTEVLGAILLVFGFAVRWISIPLFITMLVAIFSVHISHGWQAIHDKLSPFASGDVDGAIQRLTAAKNILQTHGNYEWLTATGNFVISNKGMEWAATYAILLFVLIFIGSGKYVSADYWIAKKFRQS